MSTSNKKKGVNLKDFLAKRKVNLLKQEIKKAPEHKEEKGVVKSTPIVVSKNAISDTKKIETAKVNIKKTPTKKPKIEKPSMFKFLDISQPRYPDKIISFIKWNATAPQERIHKTQNDIAKELGVDINTLSDWKMRDGFWEEVALYRSKIYRKFSSRVLYGIMQRAASGDARAGELFLSVFEGYKKKSDVEVSTHPISEKRLKEIEKVFEMHEESAKKYNNGEDD